MIIELDVIFRYKVHNVSKLVEAGFVETDNYFKKAYPIMKNQFNTEVTINQFSKVSFKVIEVALNEEYNLINVESAQGGFVDEVRSECNNVFIDIAEKCFDIEILKAEQTKRIINSIEASYEVKPEYLWEKYPSYAVFKRNDNQKWFAIIMTIARSKLGLNGHGDIEIIDIKSKPDLVEAMLKQAGYYPAYHMNKKHWITVLLDGSLSDEAIIKLLSLSYVISKK